MIQVTEKALSEFKKVLDIEENKGLGVMIKASEGKSCCSSCGPSYEMDLVEQGDEGDVELVLGGVKFFTNDASLELMKGLEVDFMEEHGFFIKDDNEEGCGCGGDHGGCCG
ncbi:MAG TPA: iron-sulfur cluster biosynthesis family protein [Nitrospirota bacterium]|jgi:iron-sulfur cluster assembly accessory protein